MFWGVCKNIKGVLFILIFFQADVGKMIYFLQKKAIQVKHQPVDKHVCVGIYKGGPRVFKTEKEFNR